MKQQFKNLVIVAISGLLISITACKKSTPISENQTPIPDAKIKTDGVTAWQIVFADYFNDQNTFNSHWEKTGGRNDYNSSICHYDNTVPILDTKDGKSVMVLTATKLGNYSYKSGHIKSYYNFKPANNEEYRVVSNIKLIAQDGSTYKGFAQTYGAWPAFWTVRESNEWPTKGEIDIMEGYSKYAGTKFTSNIFYGSTVGNPTNVNAYLTNYNTSVTEGWHKYEEYWKNVNGVVTVTTRLDDVDQATFYDSGYPLGNFGPHNIILNLCVGSNSDINIFDNSQINLFSKTMMWVDNVTVEKRNIY